MIYKWGIQICTFFIIILISGLFFGIGYKPGLVDQQKHGEQLPFEQQLSL